MSNICGPHRLGARRPNEVRFRHRANLLRGMSTALGCIEYGTDVTIAIDAADHFNSYSLSLPLSGEQALRSGGRSLDSRPGRGVIVSPNQSQELEITADCRKLQVVIPRLSLHKTLEEMLQSPADKPLVFEQEMDASQGATAAWWRMVNHLNDEMAHSELYTQPFFNRDLERALIKGLILAQPNNYSTVLQRNTSGKLPNYLERARDYIHRHAHESFSMDDLERAAGVSRFKLFDCFRKHLGCPPMTYLKQYRLHAVHEALLSAKGPRNVSTVAMDWGFTHLGRFAGDYKKCFGETPSATLDRMTGKGLV
jgi:AraC-like DNA-binding protein